RAGACWACPTPAGAGCVWAAGAGAAATLLPTAVGAAGLATSDGRLAEAAAGVAAGRAAVAVAPAGTVVDAGSFRDVGLLPLALQALTNRTARTATDSTTRIEALLDERRP